MKKSLQTSDRKEAKAAASLLVHKAETAFLRLRMGMLTERELEQVTARLVADFTVKFDGHRKQYGDSLEFLMQGAPYGICPHSDFEVLDATFKFPKQPKVAAAIYESRIRALENERATGDYSWETRTLARRMAPEGVEMPPPDWYDENEAAWSDRPPVAFARVCDAVIAGLIEGYQAETERVQGRRNHTIEAAVNARVEQARPKKRLRDLWHSYKNDRMATKSWSSGTIKKYEGFHRLFIDVVGDCELCMFEDEGMVANLIENLQRYPKGKHQITSPYRGKPFDPAWASRSGFKGLEPSQVNEMLIQQGAWFDYALQRPKVWGITFNPFKNKRLPVAVADRKPKSGYITEEIGRLVKGLLKQRPLVQPERFWVPLLGIFTAARISELCQLRVEDLEQKDGVWIINIRHQPDKMQFIKSKLSRYCPVHPTLLSLGFIDFL